MSPPIRRRPARRGRAHWYTVTATGPLASDVDRSLNRGDRVILSGTTTVRAWNDRGVEGTTTFIELERCGHDPAWGASRWTSTPMAKRPDRDGA